ncbi:amidohydrolase family protein [Spongisporangium articulatum]|uniref:Amidohydrolase family protein n=1 Tax=Spongisporangium articulatum TaxID=3362603 RepID=A0ABW8AN01_9ACTN
MSGLTDVHAHFLTERYVEAATAAGHAEPDGMPAWPEWDAGRHLRLMDATGIDTAVLSISSPGVHFGDDARARALAVHVNDHAADLSGRHDGRFRFFAALPLPDLEGALDEVRRTAGAPGLAGYVVLSNAHGRYPGDPQLEPLWRALDAAGTVAFLHPTSPPGWESVSPRRPRPMAEFMFETARAVVDLMDARVAERHPAIRFVVTHCGGAIPGLADRLQLFRWGDAMDGVPESVDEQLRRLWFDVAGTPLPTQLPALLQHVGEDRIVYGSDHCFTPASAVALQLGALDAGRDGWRALCSRNVETLLGAGRPAAPPGVVPRARAELVRRVFRRAAERLLLGQG